MQQEEAGEAERVDHPQLLLEPRARRGGVRVGARVALLELDPAQLGELAERLLVLRARIAVAEVGVQVEDQARGELLRLGDGVRVLGEARRHRRRRGEHVREVAAAQGLGGVERRVVAQGDEGVLQRRPLARVRVDVAGGDGRHAQAAGQLGQRPVARAVVAQERPLELDAQAITAEAVEQRAQRRLVVDAVGGAAAQADEPGGVLDDRGERELRRHVDPPHAGADQRLVAALPGAPRGAILGVLVDRSARVRVRAREQEAQVPPAVLVLHQQREVAPVVEVDLRAVDRPQPERRGRLGELHRARDAVVVGERHRPVPELGRGGRQLVGQRRAVEEREGRVGVELDVHCEHMFAYRPDAVRCETAAPHAR